MDAAPGWNSPGSVLQQELGFLLERRDSATPCWEKIQKLQHIFIFWSFIYGALWRMNYKHRGPKGFLEFLINIWSVKVFWDNVKKNRHWGLSKTSGIWVFFLYFLLSKHLSLDFCWDPPFLVEILELPRQGRTPGDSGDQRPEFHWIYSWEYGHEL